MEARHRLQQSPRDPLNVSTAVVAAGAEIGGAERSLLEGLSEGAVFLLPGPGGLSRALESAGYSWETFALPPALSGLTRGGGLGRVFSAIPLLWQLPPHLSGLYRHVRPASQVVSLGVKSHVRCLFLAPWLRARLVFDVRDFIRPLFLRTALRFATRLFGCRVRANSRAVAKDYPGAEVLYPAVRLSRPSVSRRKPGPPWVIAHAAFFAPYKGQDLFLETAAKLLSAGVDAQFWLMGGVIYPGSEYSEYADKLGARAMAEDLRGRVRFFGTVGDAQELLEQSHLLLHCTREPEPFGRVILEGLQCGCEVVCHQGSGACEVLQVSRDFPAWMAPLGELLGGEYVRVTPPGRATGRLPLPEG